MIYHSSPAKFSTFRHMSHFGTLKAAIHRISAYTNSDVHYMYVCDIDFGRCKVIQDFGNENEWLHVDLAKQNVISKSEYHYLRSIPDHLTRMEMLSEILNQNGIDSLKYINCAEDSGSWSYISTNPSKIKILSIEEL